MHGSALNLVQNYQPAPLAFLALNSVILAVMSELSHFSRTPRKAESVLFTLSVGGGVYITCNYEMRNGVWNYTSVLYK